MDTIDEKQKAFTHREILKAKAIRESMVEVMREHQQEIIRRTIQKLKAQNIEVSVGEIQGNL